MSKTKLTFATQALAFAGALSLFAATSSAAVVADGTPFNPGVPLAGSANFGGTVVANLVTNFAETVTPTFTGSLRTVVVQNGGGTLDFYYQLSNIVSTINPGPPPTSNAPADIFRMTIDGFDPFATGVMDFSTNGLAGIAGAGAFVVGNKSAKTADRDPSIGTGVGFGFASNPGLPLFDPNNINQGDTSFFMVVRTNATQYFGSTATISGFGTAFAQTLAPANVSAIPEPGSALVGLAVMGLCGSGLFRRNRKPAIA